MNQSSKCLHVSDIKILLYGINTFMRLAVEVTNFHPTQKG